MQQAGRSRSSIALQQLKVGGMSQELSTNDELLFNRRTKEQELLGVMATLSKSATDPNRSQDERKAAQTEQEKAANALAANRKEQQQLELIGNFTVTIQQ
jgi:predicted exporter